MAATLAAALQAAGASASLVNGDWSTQAQAANERSVEVYVAVEVVDEHLVEAVYFAVPGFESAGGRHLAELVVKEIPAAPGWGIGSVRGLRLPILRETRAPAVLIRVGDPAAVRDGTGLLVPAVQRALDAWTAEPC
jgi:hypothetical protein